MSEMRRWRDRVMCKDSEVLPLEFCQRLSQRTYFPTVQRIRQLTLTMTRATGERTDL